MHPLCDVCLKAGIIEPAAGLWKVDGGCIVLPGIDIQCLCLQHEVTCEPLDDEGEGVVLLEDYV